MLSTTSQYALRALVQLSRLKGGEALLGRELSLTTKIPGNYLAKVLVALNRAGIVEATRGPHGGYRLRRPAEDIHLLEVVTVFEGESTIPNCILHHSRVCTDDHPCLAHRDWKAVSEVYTAFLRDTTIARIASGGVAVTSQSPDGKAVTV